MVFEFVIDNFLRKFLVFIEKKLVIKSFIINGLLQFFCNNTKTFSCYLEIDTGVSFFSKNNTPNFMALKV